MLDVMRYRMLAVWRRLVGALWWSAWRAGYDRGWDDATRRASDEWERAYAEGYAAGVATGVAECHRAERRRRWEPYEAGFDD